MKQPMEQPVGKLLLGEQHREGLPQQERHRLDLLQEEQPEDGETEGPEDSHEKKK